MKKFIILLMALTLSATMIFAAATADKINLTSTIPELDSPAIQLRGAKASADLGGDSAVIGASTATVLALANNAVQDAGSAFFDIYQSATTNFLHAPEPFTMDITAGSWIGATNSHQKGTEIKDLEAIGLSSNGGVTVSESVDEEQLTLTYNVNAIQYADTLATFTVSWNDDELTADDYTSIITISYEII